MEDLSDVNRALSESLTTSAEDGSSFQFIFESFITSDDPRIRQATVEALHETLTKGSDQQKSLVLEHAGLTFVPLLISQYRSSPGANIPELVKIIASTSSAKEVVLSLVECLGRLEDEAQGVDADETDNEEDDDLPPADHVECLRLLLACFALAIPRLKTDRSTPTLLSISDPLIDAFTVIAPFTSSLTAPSLVEVLCEMIDVTWKWVQTTSDTSGEQKAILTNILFMGTTLMSSRLDAKLVERLFVRLHPRYGQLHDVSADSWMPSQRALQRASVLACTLGSKIQDLIHRLTHPSSISPYSSLSSLTLLVTSLPGIHAEQHPSQLDAEDASPSEPGNATNAVASGSKTGPVESPEVTPTLLEDSMPVLSAALSADALDAGLAWTWYLVQNGAQVSYDTATLLLELLVPPAVGSPSPMTRIAIIKLIGRVIDMIEDPKSQALLFLQLAEPENPFEGVRVQSITMLRDAISKPSSPLLAHLGALTPTLFSLPTSTVSPTLSSFAPATATTAVDVPPLQLPTDALLSSMWLSWFIETVNLLWLILTLDRENQSGMRTQTRLKGVYRDWVIPQRSKVADMRRESSIPPNGSAPDAHDSHEGRGEVDFVLDRWDDALDRLCEEIRGVLGNEMDAGTAGGLASIEE